MHSYLPFVTISVNAIFNLIFAETESTVSISKLSDILGGVVIPPGCNCVKSSQDGAICDAFDCSCNCDMTLGLCDLNCCCDEDCLEEVKNKCILPPNPVSKMCYERNVGLEYVNPTYPARISSSLEVRN